MINLDLTIEAPDGSDISYGIAHLSNGSYAGVNVSGSWDTPGAASLTYWCDWDDVENFIFAMIGLNEVIEEGANTRYSRFLPHQYPVSFAKNLWGTRISNVRGIPGEYTNSSGTVIHYPIFENGKIKYRYAEVTVEYESVLWEMLSDADTPYDQEWMRFTTVQKTPRLDYIQAQVGSFYWIDSPEVSRQTALPHPLPLREESMDYIVTFHRCPEPFLNPFDYVGYANSFDQFLAGHPQVPADGFDAQTMQLVGMGEIIRPVAFTDVIYYDYQYFFKNQPNGFNKIRKVTPTTFNYTAFSLDGLTPSAPTIGSPTTGNATRAIKLQDLSLLFLPN